MKTPVRSLAITLTLLTMSLAACGKSTETIVVGGAVKAVSHLLQYASGKVITNRPSATLGLYAALFLSQGKYFAVTSATTGVDSVLALTKPISVDDLDDAFLLLQEFGGVLQVDVPDLLNRAPDRSAALNEYLRGLTNITQRALLKQKELEASIELTQKKSSDTRKELQAIDRQIRDAQQAEDYATLGTLQQRRSPVQETVDRLNSEVKRLNDVLDLYEKLLGIANKRGTAIAANREALVAGIQVTDIPGVEDLGVLQEASRRRGSTGGTFGGSFDEIGF